MSDLLSQASLVLIPSGYKEDVVYSEIPTDGSGDMVFSRAGDGTRINSAGLVENCPWNLMTYSEDLTNTSQWNPQTSGTGTASVTGNYAVAPNGTTTADRVQVNGGTGYAMIAADEPVINGQIYTYSVWLKSLSGTPKIAVIYDGSIVQTATLTSDWVRYTFTFTATGGNTYPRFGVWQANWGTSLSADFLAWGAQLNIGSTAKPYFPTTNRQDVPRLTYQNGGGGCPSLLLEKQSTNLALYSEQFDNAYWGKLNATVTANNTTSPDGTTSADRINDDSTSGSHYISSSAITILTATNYTFTAYLKANTLSWCRLELLTGGCFFDLANGVLGTASGATASIQSVGNGWYRCTITVLSAAVLAYPTIRLSTGNGVFGYVGNGSSIYAWGAQLEAAQATSYIPTTSATVTRLADSAYKTGISSLIGQTEGTIFVDVENNETETACIISTNVGTGNASHIYIGQNGTNLALYIRNASTYSVLASSIANVIGRKKIAVAYGASFARVYMNGAQVYDTTTAVIPSGLDRLQMNIFDVSSDIGTAKYNSVIYFKTKLTNAELASLTTL